ISKARYGSRMALIGSAWIPWWMRPAGLSTLPNLHKIAFVGRLSGAHPPLTSLGGPRALGQRPRLSLPHPVTPADLGFAVYGPRFCMRTRVSAVNKRLMPSAVLIFGA